MKLQLLPSSIDADGRASGRQHLLTIIIDDVLAVDAGCLAMSCSELQRKQVRDILLTHTHLDHIAGLPLYIDDLFATLTEPVRIHASRQMIDTLERDIFNWTIYPRFSELTNDHGPVIEYRALEPGQSVAIKHLTAVPIAVNHKVAATGFLISDDKVSVAVTGDTAETEEFWNVCNSEARLAAVFVECAFPNELEQIARDSHHFTPRRLAAELAKLDRPGVPVHIINIKPMYREQVMEELGAQNLPNVAVAEVGKVYEF